MSSIAGSIASKFIKSKLTPLLMIAFLMVGFYAASLTPKEEEPQIDVPIADIFVKYPGASAEEVESRIIKPLEDLISDIKGVEYVYSQSMPERAMLVVRYYVGEDIERSIVKLYNEIQKNMDLMPRGVSLPLVKTRSIDDVPVLALTLFSENYGDYQLRRIGQELSLEMEKIKDVSATLIYGGSGREIQILLDPEKMAAHSMDPIQIQEAIQSSHQQLHSGEITSGDRQLIVETGDFFKSVEDIENLVIAVSKNQPVYLKQVASVVDGPGIHTEYVTFGYGANDRDKMESFPDHYPAITLSIAKKKGADAMAIADKVLQKLEFHKNDLIPSDVQIEITRNYGQTASHKVNELMLHLAGAILAVTLVVALSMGWRGGLVVFLSVPVTFALTLFVYYVLGYTLNRITLFALVFVTGIVVDDSIIIAENMHRHFKMRKMPFLQAAIASINEVGNPTILATFTVIAAVLPMIAVSGLMGPYMSPMPIGASLAMIFSLLVALIITPWLAYGLLKGEEKIQSKPFVLEESRIYKMYAAILNPMIQSSWKRWTFIGSITLLLMGSMTLLYFKLVAVKMLPFDNKNEFQIVIDMPEGTTLERTAVVASEITAFIKNQPDVVNFQSYVGASSPINFNGLVRHYDLRSLPNTADIQVNLSQKGNRSAQSHDIAKQLRPTIQAIAKKYQANVKVVEVPPGPPVISTLVAEIYGEDYEQQKSIANQLKNLLDSVDDVVDIDWMVESDQTEYQISIDKEKALLLGISPAHAVQAVHTALHGSEVISFYQPTEVDPIPVNLRLEEKYRSDIHDILKINLKSNTGDLVSLGDIALVEESVQDKSIYRKNQKRVVYVTADLAGQLESPVYAIMEASERLSEINLPEGYQLNEYFTSQPFLEQDYGIKWDGEWHITYEVFRDLGAAFAVVLVIIYMLIIGWFQDFKVPFVMMVAIPLSLVGILVGHWILGAYFTATSMIGMIALAGIMVRNSILLIDFINLRLKDGVSLEKAVIEAGAVRTTPILLTAGTVVIGAFVILFDPIFQGLAISLMGGSIASTALTLVIVPLIYYMTEKKDMRLPNPPPLENEKKLKEVNEVIA